MFMLIANRDKKESTFYVECANWKAIINAVDPTEAATMGFEEGLAKYSKAIQVSPVVTVLDISSSMRDLDIQENIHFVYTPTVLANAGMHKTSKNFQEIIQNLQRTIE